MDPSTNMQPCFEAKFLIIACRLATFSSAAGKVWSITRSTFDGSYSLSILISLRERIASGPVLSCAIARSTLTTAMSPAIDDLEEVWLWLGLTCDDVWRFFILFVFWE